MRVGIILIPGTFLGLIIEAATGHSYYEEVTRRFLEPLQLSLTTPSDRRELPGLAAGYMAADDAVGQPAKTTLAPASWPGIPVSNGPEAGFAGTRRVEWWAKALFEGRAIEGHYLDDTPTVGPY